MLEIGKKIKTLRQQKGWSQSDVAVRIGISIAAFSKIETDITDISMSRLLQISEIFEVGLAELILPSEEHPKQYVDELKKAKETIEVHLSKIVNLQEYIITLYEELLQVKKRADVNN